jgi:hypothetical protein
MMNRRFSSAKRWPNIVNRVGILKEACPLVLENGGADTDERGICAVGGKRERAFQIPTACRRNQENPDINIH